MLTLKIPVQNIEATRQIVLNHKIIDFDYKIKVENGFGHIPIKEGTDDETLTKVMEECKEEIIKQNENYTIEIMDLSQDDDLETVKRFPRSITELLKDKLSEEEIEELKKSFDIIGDVVIVEIPEDLEAHKKEIGQATLQFTKRKTVYMKKSAVKGVTRVRELELIAGEDNPITIHKEHGTRLKLDVKNVYFSPRLATERKRVQEATHDGEEILDMFAGIGPFPIVIAHEKNVNITAVDINEYAIKYLNENIKLNKLAPAAHITAICGDTNEVALNELKGKKFDRLIMNLPGLAPEFLDLAVSLCKDGGVIHYYEFSDGFSQGIERAQIACEKQNKKVEILNTRKVKSSSPGMWHVAIDCKVTEKNKKRLKKIIKKII
ncbi:class I SAM-dependent methyltransferase [Methanobrevibacter sp.]|uniref:class I SAM-dependent methyltransferase n=1 Tax=Methanobrevibacter sp. TaxID=66852 RepID=UPI0038674B71